MSGHAVRQARAADYHAIVSVASDWWGRDVLAGLPRLFLDHFHTTSLIAERGTAMTGFLVGLYSPSEPEEAYIHYVAVDPSSRRDGLARLLYEEFFDRACRAGRKIVYAVTSPANEGSIAFHHRMGFAVSSPVPDFNGPGRDMVRFTRRLAD